MGDNTELKGDFKEKVKEEIKKTKRFIYREEISSAMVAMAFGINLASILSWSLGFFTILNIIAGYYCLKMFRPLVKRQSHLHSQLNFLKETLRKGDNDEIWKT